MSTSVETMIKMISQEISNFLVQVKGKPFPSEIKTPDEKMFSFSTDVTGTEFRITCSTQKVNEEGKFVLYLNSAFMSQTKTNGSITVHGVPLHGIYETFHAISNVTDEDELDNEIYRIIEEAIPEHVSKAL